MATIHLYHGTIDTGTIGVSELDCVYKIGNDYYGFSGDRLKVYQFLDGRLQLAIDIHLADMPNSRKFISIANDKLQYQEIYANQSKVGSLNLNGSIYEPNQSFPVVNPVIYAWNDQRIVIDPYNYNLYIHTLDGLRCRTYSLVQPVLWISNPIYYTTSGGDCLYFLALIQSNQFCVIKLDNYIHYSGTFYLDFPQIAVGKITISIESDRLSIWCPTQDRHDIFYLVKPLVEFQFVKNSNALIQNKGVANLTGFLNKNMRFVSSENFSMVKNLVKGIQPIEKNPIFIDIYQFPKYHRAYVEPPVEKILTTTTNTPQKTNPEVHIQSTNYMDYFRWIIDNYDNYDIKTVIFYGDYNAQIPFVLADRTIYQSINLYTLSAGFDNFVIPFGKISLNTGKSYTRQLAVFQSYLSITNLATLNGYSRNVATDQMVEDNQSINSIMRDRIIHFFITIDRNLNEIIWTPIMFYKLDMRLVRERPKAYYERAFQIFDMDLNLGSIMGYLFYSLIYQ